MKQHSANQQETLDFIIKFMKTNGINLFNNQSLQDSSIMKDNKAVPEETDSDKFYYSQDVLEEHKKLESSNDVEFLQKVIKQNQSIPDYL
jgi:hypothetical protein